MAVIDGRFCVSCSRFAFVLWAGGAGGGPARKLRCDSLYPHLGGDYRVGQRKLDVGRCGLGRGPLYVGSAPCLASQSRRLRRLSHEGKERHFVLSLSCIS